MSPGPRCITDWPVVVLVVVERGMISLPAIRASETTLVKPTWCGMNERNLRFHTLGGVVEVATEIVQVPWQQTSGLCRERPSPLIPIRNAIVDLNVWILVSTNASHRAEVL